MTSWTQLSNVKGFIKTYLQIFKEFWVKRSGIYYSEDINNGNLNKFVWKFKSLILHKPLEMSWEFPRRYPLELSRKEVKLTNSYAIQHLFPKSLDVCHSLFIWISFWFICNCHNLFGRFDVLHCNYAEPSLASHLTIYFIFLREPGMHD